MTRRLENKLNLQANLSITASVSHAFKVEFIFKYSEENCLRVWQHQHFSVFNLLVEEQTKHNSLLNGVYSA